MIEYVKSKLLKDPEKIKEYLEYFDFHKISIRTNYMSFARSNDADSSPKSIVIRLTNNDALLVHDYPKAIVCDIFNYVIKMRGKTFKEVFSEAKRILGIDSSYFYEERTTAPFGGFYRNIKRQKDVQLKTYDDSILDDYIPCGNERFLRDGISLETQRKFNIGFSVVDQAITIPIWDEVGNLIGVKMRCNHDVQDGEQKYWYDFPTMMSQTLYNYANSYEHLESADIIYILEAEKGCMQYISKLGLYNCVGLGSGSISKKQVQMLLSLNPNKIVFLHDVSYEKEAIMKNIQTVKAYSRMKQIDVGYWDNEKKGYEDKVSCTDLSVEKLEYILENEIKFI